MQKVIKGECLKALKKMDSNSIDTIITDPPYGLSFMGKKWDYDVPSVEIWQEALRVLKPGGTALIFAGSRTQHRMAVNIEDAGFILKDTILWVYGSGFPKATDISKNIDKKAGAEREVIGKYSPPDGSKARTTQQGYKADYVGTDHTTCNMASCSNITAPTTDEAKEWDGWKSHGLKPAYEPILVCMKPNEGSYADNALKWGVAGLNIDAGRVEVDGTEDRSRDNSKCKDNDFFKGKKRINVEIPKDLGRFPANFIHDGSEEVVELFPINNTKGSGIRKNKKNPYGDSRIWSVSNTPAQNTAGYTDSGSAARFFYCAKVSKAERNIGCEDLEEKRYLDKIGCHGVKPGSAEKIMKEQGCTEKEVNEIIHQKATNKNSHPTVKPIKLMEYLCNLTSTPKGGIVLDPFAGSGSTGLACQNTNRDFILIEREQEYIEIIRARLKGNQKKEIEEPKEPKQNTIWDIHQHKLKMT